MASGLRGFVFSWWRKARQSISNFRCGSQHNINTSISFTTQFPISFHQFEAVLTNHKLHQQYVGPQDENGQMQQRWIRTWRQHPQIHVRLPKPESRPTTTSNSWRGELALVVAGDECLPQQWWPKAHLSTRPSTLLKRHYGSSTWRLMTRQMSCPLIETLWEKRVDEEAFRHKRAKQSESGFHTIKRKPTERERKKHLYAAIMTHTLHGDVIVPDILLRPLNKISYLDLIHKILTANPTKNLDLFVLYDLWEAILTKIYDYEYNWREDKKDEVGLSECPFSKTVNPLLTLIAGQNCGYFWIPQDC